jgi:uncharacterized protein YcbX
MAAVTEIHVFPVKGAPGEDLAEAVVGPEGLVGDRRKKAAVQVVAAQDLRPDTRANLVVSLGSDQLAAVIGSVLRVGEVQLDVTSAARNCPGVYAAVRRPGTVQVGDVVEIVAQTGA